MPEVTLYVIPGCLRCRHARLFLRRHRVLFKEVNALRYPKSLVRLPSGVLPEFPVVTVGSEVIRGTNLRALARALRHRQRPPPGRVTGY